MQKPRLAMPCWLILSLVLGVLLSALVSCTPVKGYSGVERPQEQIALVSVDTDNINGATVDGVVFGSSGVSLLPGQYTFQVSASHGAPPYQCRPYTVIDTYGFDRCQREREAEIRKDKGKDKKRPRECLLSVYTKHRKSCLRDYHDSACEVTLALAAGKEYEIDVPPGITGPPSVVAYAVSGNFLSKDRERVPFTGACRFVGTRTEQEDYEAW